jgi:hypothetical protein
MGSSRCRHRDFLPAWATTVAYQTAPPQPDRFVAANGTVLMTGDGIAAGKGGFQKADLMDYGSLYGMGSYYGEDYTASALVRLGTATQNNMAMTSFGKSFEALTFEQQASATAAMRNAMQGIDLPNGTLSSPPRSPTPSSPCATRSSDLSTPPIRPRARRRITASARSSRNKRRIFWCSRRLPQWRGGPGSPGHGPRTGPSSRWSATRRPPTPSVRPGSASASPSLPSASCCSFTSSS